MRDFEFEEFGIEIRDEKLYSISNHIKSPHGMQGGSGFEFAQNTIRNSSQNKPS
jgi:hypothetical protein